MELLLSAAPKLANLYVYEAPNTTAGMIDGYARIIADNKASVISTSWITCEAGLSTAAKAAENTTFATAASLA